MSNSKNMDDLEAKFTEDMSIIGMTTSGIIHDIKNPIALVLGYVQEIKKGNIPETSLPKIYTKIEKSCNQILSIIDHTKELVKQQQAPKIDENLKIITDNIAEQMTPLIDKFKIKFNIDFKNKDIKLKCSKTQIGQVLNNIINNSIYVVKNLENPWIKISVFTNPDKKTVIEIIDCGKINMEIADKIFAPQYTTKGSEGTGLGLYWSKKIIENHGGTISVDNKPNTTFTIIF